MSVTDVLYRLPREIDPGGSQVFRKTAWPRIGGMILVSLLALPAAAAPPSLAVIGQTGTKTNTTCLRERCDVYRDDTLSVVAQELRKSGLFTRVATGTIPADYGVRVEFTYTLLDPVERNMVKQLMATHNANAQPPIYRRVFHSKFTVMRGAASFDALQYDLSVDARDPAYRGLVNARDVALKQMVTRFLSDARARGLMGLQPLTASNATVASPAYPYAPVSTTK
jgi:hypothetical protein